MEADSLARIYQHNQLRDTARLELLRKLSFNEVTDYNLALRYAEELILLSEKEANDKYLFHGYFQKGNKYRILGNYDQALEAYFKSADIAKRSGSPGREGSAYSTIASIYSLAGNHENSTLYHRKAVAALKDAKDSVALASIILNAGEAFRLHKDYDSALVYFREAEKIFEVKEKPEGKAYALGNIGMIYTDRGNYETAKTNFNEAIKILESAGDYYPVCAYLISLSYISLEEGDAQGALDYAHESLRLAQQHKLLEQISDANLQLSSLYETAGKFPEALIFYKNYIVFKDSLNDRASDQKMANLRTNFEVSQEQEKVLEMKKKRNLNRLLLFISLGILLVITVLVLKLLKNNRQKQKAFTLIRKEKEMTEEQRDQTNKALQELKRAQAHLIQSEKMASLGELMAGIAHEIQNPLNFVNNFSEINTELITELQEENNKENPEAVRVLSEEIFSNEKKINQHGKRADAIVKGMLEHSRTGAPEKRSTNINRLADEYFRLAYLGLRAKDKSFSATTNTDFDPDAGKINIVPQEIGRVILNISNNAFHAVAARSKEAPDDYTPAVTVSTKKTNDQLQIVVKDNGAGIPVTTKEKIFQPFFTTKGPGVGTGLGLSISYDIVKAHGGEISFQSEQGNGSEFTITLPLDRSES
jgi:signal transduction histidine kinase